MSYNTNHVPARCLSVSSDLYFLKPAITNIPCRGVSKWQLHASPCRARKVKCNGIRPECDVCAMKTGVVCSYNSDRSENICKVDSVTTRRHRQRPRPIPTSSSGSIPSFVSQSGSVARLSSGVRTLPPPAESSTRISHRTVSSSSAVNDVSNPLPELSRSGNGTDSMIGAISGSSSNLEFFGKSSAGSFMRQIRTGMDSRLGHQSDNTESALYSSSEFTELPRRSFKSNGPELQYVLPSRKTADSLAEYYWNSTHLVYPFLDRASMEEDYRALWTGSKTKLDERVAIATINMIFALGAQVSKAVAPEQRQETGRLYFDRAQSAVDIHSWDAGSIDLVSYLLLTGVFFQTINAAQRCWMVTGHAIRMAQSLGLHLLRPDIGTQSRRKAEVTRRVWHGCILMDRVLSMTFGRPAMISNCFFSAVPLPSAIDDEFLDVQEESSLVRPDGHPCLMMFYPAQLQFYDIVNDILLNLYSVNSESQEYVYDIATVLRLDKALMAWIQNLPSQLQEPCAPHLRGSSFERLGIVNKIRFFFTRILLFRPVLAQFCLQNHDTHPAQTGVENLGQIMVVQCSRLCLKDAHQVIDLVYKNLEFDTVTGPLPSWWYCVLYVYTAATVLLAQRLQPALADGYCESLADVSWNRSIEILGAYARVGASAKQCVGALEALSAKNPWEPSTAAPRWNQPPSNGRGILMPLQPSLLWDNSSLGENGLDSNDMAWLHSFASTP